MSEQANTVDQSAPVEAMMATVKWELLPQGESLSSDQLYATHEGWLDIGGFRLKCYQLNNGERVFDADCVERFFNGEALRSPMAEAADLKSVECQFESGRRENQ
jgi:hypothetical protein